MADLDYIPIEKSKCSHLERGRFLFAILLLLFLGLVVFLTLTYMLQLHCDDDDAAKTSNIGNSMSFVLFSDIHLDLFYKDTAGKSGFCRDESIVDYKAKYGRIGCDSPLALLRSALANMKNRSADQRNIDFAMFTGDTVAHRLTTATRRSIVLETINISLTEVISAFPGIPYFPSIGNNDLPGHYVMPTVNDTWYSDLLDIWQDAIICTNCESHYKTTTKEELRKTFLKGGYYSASIAGGTMTLLVLNSMYWTKSTWKPYDYFVQAAEMQMQWLQDQLLLARKLQKRVLITSHIPPGVDPYLTKQGYQSLWFRNFTELYFDLVVHKFSDVIAGQLYAHFHKDSFRFLHDEKRDPSFQNSSFILLVPSISPVYNNNPSFRFVHIDPELQSLTDYEQYYMNIVMATEFDNPVWQLDYKFSKKYPASARVNGNLINGNWIMELSDNLINQTNDDIFTEFITSRQVRYQPDHYSRFIYYCAVRFAHQDDFNVCQKKFFVPGG